MNFKKITVLFFMAFVVVSFVTCKGETKTKSVVVDKDSTLKDTIVPVAKTAKVENNYNDMARFFAGMKPLKDEKLISMTKDSVWIKHSIIMSNGFKNIEENRFSEIRKWRDVELKEANSQGIKNMFYPLSGPDFLNAFILFPNHVNYIMVALEPSGKIKDVTKMKREDERKYLGNISGSLVDIFNRSYFITKRMSGDFSRWKIEGNLPTLMVFLARTDNTIKNIKRVAIDQDGKLIDFGLNDTIPRKYISKGVQIDFVHATDTFERHVYYFSTNIGDMEFDHMPGLDTNKGFVKFVQGFAPFNSFCKAASYLLHYGTFSIARNLVLDNSQHHVQ
ncbi:MAG: hypothetical protein HYZ42_10505, partial [Bacteroidetes bacterium]|nr:hypothetical protein [Bacteroidota bacterium]